jgi:hypothetical protein
MTAKRRVVEQAIGEMLSGEPLDDPSAEKNPRSVAAGKIGGRVGAMRGLKLFQRTYLGSKQRKLPSSWKSSSGRVSRASLISPSEV